MTFTLYGLTAYEVQYWTGTTWASVPNASVVGNNKVWRKFTFPALTTTKIRVVTSAGLASYSRLTEVEAYQATQAVANDSVQWLVSDHLGTPRMVADLSGSLAGIKRHDYLPFGEELIAGVGGRTTGQGYSGDNVRQQFTGYERDDETGLDYAINRYYESMQGRFASPDEPLVGQNGQDPQTWNLYSYTSNNPLNRVDPDGRRWFTKKGEVPIWVDANDDGTYTSPGEGWAEFIPTKDQSVYVITRNGMMYEFGENKDGSPRTRSLWTGMVQDSSFDLLALALGGNGFVKIAQAAHAAHQAARQARAEKFEREVNLYTPSKNVKDVIDKKRPLETLSRSEREVAARWYEKVAERVKGTKAEQAKRLNQDRARYLREGGKPPGKIHEY